MFARSQTFRKKLITINNGIRCSIVETAALIKVVAEGDAVARRRYALDHPCAGGCRRFKLPFTVSVSGRFEERAEASAKRPRRQKNYACSPIHGSLCTANGISSVRSSAALARSTHRPFFHSPSSLCSAGDRSHDVDVALNTVRRFPPFLSLFRTRREIIRRVPLSFVHA